MNSRFTYQRPAQPQPQRQARTQDDGPAALDPRASAGARAPLFARLTNGHLVSLHAASLADLQALGLTQQPASDQAAAQPTQPAGPVVGGSAADFSLVHVPARDFGECTASLMDGDVPRREFDMSSNWEDG